MASTQSFGAFELAGWEDEATAAQYDRHLSAVTTQSIEALLDDARVGAGHRVLDIATGAGYVAAAVLKRGARPVGIDFSATQVGLARQRYPAIAFQQADAEALPFGPASFDAVVNAFGLCHLPNPDRALRETLRVLKPGGRLAFSVWDMPERVVGFGALYAAIQRHGAMDAGLPVGPNFFLFSDPAYSAKTLRDAGFNDPTFRQVPQIWRTSTADEVFDILSTATVRAAALLRAQTAEVLESIRTAVREVVSGCREGGGYALPMPALVAAAVKP